MPESWHARGPTTPLRARSSGGRWERYRRGESGAALLELTVVLPLVMALALGIFTGGTAYFRKITIVDAVREGARYGATLRVPMGIEGVVSWEDSVKSRVTAASGGELSSENVCVKLVYATGGSDCGVTDPAGASAENNVRLVKVSASKSATIEFFFFTRTSTLSGQLAARFERDTG